MKIHSHFKKKKKSFSERTRQCDLDVFRPPESESESYNTGNLGGARHWQFSGFLPG